MYHRVFGASGSELSVPSLLKLFESLGISSRFRGDEQGWFSADFGLDGESMTLERFLASEEGIRHQLNSWAAWLETQEHNPHRDRLMRHMIATKQVFTLEGVEPELGTVICQYLARGTDGVYQVDGQGFFDVDGTLLVPEST